jgi:hypothetical protein
MKCRPILCWLALLGQVSCATIVSQQTRGEARAASGGGERATAVGGERAPREEPAEASVPWPAVIVVEEPDPDEDGDPRVDNLTLTTVVDPSSGLPAGPPLDQVRGDEPVLYISLTFWRMPPGRRLEVCWFDDGLPGEPIASSAFEVSGRGSLAVSLAPGDPLGLGPYHVEVRSDGAVLATLRFEVDRPEDHPRHDLGGP